MARKNTDLAKAEKNTTLAKPLEDWEQEIADQAKNDKAGESLGLPRITHKGGVLKYNGSAIKDNKLVVAVLGYVHSKAYYEGRYVEGVASTPVCYAFARPGPRADAELVPHEQAPEKQYERCVGCPHNAFGTAEVGRGKACKDERRLLVAFGVEGKGAQQGDFAQISVPPSSLKAWGAFQSGADQLTPLGYLGVLVEITTKPSDRGGYFLCFTIVRAIEREQVKALYVKAKELLPELEKPYPVLDEDAAPPAKKRSAKANKKM